MAKLKVRGTKVKVCKICGREFTVDFSANNKIITCGRYECRHKNYTDKLTARNLAIWMTEPICMTTVAKAKISQLKDFDLDRFINNNEVEVRI